MSPRLPRAAPLVSRTQTLGGIFNYFQTEFSRDRQDGIQVNGMTKYMNGNYGRDAASRAPVVQRAVAPTAVPLQEFHDPGGIHLPVGGLGINEHRPGTHITDGIDGRDECQARHEHLVVGLHSGHQERGMQRRRAVHSGHGILRPGLLRHHLLEPIHVRAHR